MRAADYLEMVHTQREKEGRRRKWMWEGGGGCVKKLPCGHSSFHPIQPHHLKRPEANLCGRQSVVWETVINTLEWCSLTFLPKIRKWPELNGQLSCLLCLDHWQFDFFFSQQVLNITTSDLRGGCAVKTMKRASQLLTNGTHLHKRSRGDSWPFGLLTHPQTNI